ncbi:restriction endonuclease subunit S [Paenisporosarcina sp. TG20]|uniref:restriction endonuclease subunit S n=1 Tax=Paenisporosarcina sp. TG20 TaxID=1211706 RepID=UPI0002D85D56|nr:restriction endonuclease subunit S [Paenisporosarcina sp. TG20]
MSFKATLKDLALLKNGKKTVKKKSGKYELFGANGLIGYSDDYILTKESIVIGRVGANCGSVHYLDNSAWISDNTIGVVPNENVDSYYLYYILKSLRLNELASGSAQPLVNQSILNSISIKVLSEDKQRKIGYLLRKLDEKNQSNLKIIELLEEISQTLFKLWFIDFEFPNEEGLPYKSSGGKMVESELGEIPEGWKLVTIGEMCASNKKTLSKQDKWSHLNYLDTGNITRNCIDNIQNLNIENDKIPSRAKRKIQPNDIVYSTVRPNQQHHGIIKEPLENMVASTGFVVLGSKGKYSNDLIYLWLTQEDIERNLQAVAEQSTSTYPSIKPNDILSIKILLPKEKELKELTNIIETQNNWVWASQQQNKNLMQIRDTLIPKLLSGEIDIPDESMVD